jgi:Na+-translocating ferredoxin:NAD+ oxidoreductase RnfG subunit
VLVALVALVPWAVSAKVFHSQEDALGLAFPDATRVERRTVILTDKQANRIQKLSRAPLDSKIATLHVGWRGDRVVGYAVIEVHRVRTMPEALMTILSPDGTVRSVRILAFHEPTDYLPPGRWLEQFDDKRLGAGLQLRQDIHAIAGATLSSRAVTRSVRRTLALYEVLIAATDPDIAAE